MGVKNIPGQGPITPQNRDAGNIEAPKTTRSRDAAPSVQRSSPELPPPGSSLKGKTSPLSGVITDGLAQLARAEGWEAQQSALDVLVGAMMKGKGPSREEGARPDAMSEMAFESLLAAKAPPGQRAAARKDGQQLARLAAVALGSSGLQGQRKTEQAAQLEADLAEIHKALAEVVQSPDPARTERLERVAKDLDWVASVLGRSSAAQQAQPRVDAVAGMLKILLSYA